MRILIAGVPRSGKTTLSEKLASEHDIEPIHSDDYITIANFDENVSLMMEQIRKDEDMIVEGVTVIKAVERLIREDNLPVIHEFYILLTPFISVDSHKGFITMVRNSFEAVKDHLAKKGTRIIFK